jgi:acyl-CoA synthetase (AMP-forming)/AMP-acid ligase II
MRVLREGSSSEACAALDQAWSTEATFAFLPSKGSVEPEWVEQALAALPVDARAEHFALLTSGSTGRPKLVLGSRARAERLADVLHEAQGSEPVLGTVLALPLSYCYAFVNQWLWARRRGRALAPTEGFGDPERLRAALGATESAMLCLVSAQLPLFERHFGGEAFPGVIRVHFAGGPFPQRDLDAVRRRFPNAAIFNNYGCAEAMPRLALRRAEEAESAADVGRPIEGVELAVGPAGELLFRSPYGAVACFEGDAGWRAFGAEEWIPTGDLGRLGARGTWELQGRASQVFKRYGEKIALAQVLAAVGARFGGEAQAYRERDGMGEEGYVLVLAPAPREEELRAVLAAFRSDFPRTHWPLRIEGASALPRLPSGKVDLVALAALPEKSVLWRNRI